jgi:hypothetical protein
MCSRNATKSIHIDINNNSDQSQKTHTLDKKPYITAAEFKPGSVHHVKRFHLSKNKLNVYCEINDGWFCLPPKQAEIIGTTNQINYLNFRCKQNMYVQKDTNCSTEFNFFRK